MVRLETTAKVLFTVAAEQINDAEVAQIVLEAERRLNSLSILFLAGVKVGIRVHISGDKPKGAGLVKKWNGAVPKICTGCGDSLKDIFIDGKTIFGPWAIMCENCHTTHGAGLGLGRGQKYDIKTLEKIEG